MGRLDKWCWSQVENLFPGPWNPPWAQSRESSTYLAPPPSISSYHQSWSHGMGEFLELTCCLLQSHLRDHTFNRLNFEPWGDSLRELTYLTPFTISQTHVYLMVSLVLLKPNFILDSSFLCYAWLCCHTHVHHTCFSSILPPPCSCIMLLISVMPALDSIARSDTNMYIHTVW